MINVIAGAFVAAVIRVVIIPGAVVFAGKFGAVIPRME
jgi:hypothetical protein